MRRLALPVLVLSAVLCCAVSAPRRPANPASARAARHQEFVWRVAACRFPQPRVQCLKELQPNDTRVSSVWSLHVHACIPNPREPPLQLTVPSITPSCYQVQRGLRERPPLIAQECVFFLFFFFHK